MSSNSALFSRAQPRIATEVKQRVDSTVGNFIKFHWLLISLYFDCFDPDP